MALRAAQQPIINRLVRGVAGRHITPAQSVPDREDAAHDTPIINSRNATRQWKIESIWRICASHNKQTLDSSSTSSAPLLNQSITFNAGD